MTTIKACFSIDTVLTVNFVWTLVKDLGLDKLDLLVDMHRDLFFLKKLRRCLKITFSL